MLFLRLEVELAVVMLLRRVAECRVEDLLLDLRVDLHLAVDLRQELLRLGGVALGGALELREQTADLLVVLLQERDGVVLLGRFLPGSRRRRRRTFRRGHSTPPGVEEIKVRAQVYR